MSSILQINSLFNVSTFFINPWVNGLILGVMVLGVFISFRVLNIADLSVEGILPLVTMLTAVLIKNGMNPWLVILVSIAIGAACGVLNALLTIFLKTPPLLSGIIVMALTFGFAIMINSLTGGQASFDLTNQMTVFNWLQATLISWGCIGTYANPLSYILVSLLLLAGCVALLYFFFGTELGMAIRASGKNASMSRANGINVEHMSIIALAISGGLVGLASTLYGQHNGYGLPTDGQGMIVIALSSLFLGEIILGAKSFKRSLFSTFAGSIVYWYLIQILMTVDNTGYMLSVYKALLLVAVIALQLLIAYVKRRRPNKPGEGKLSKGESAAVKEEFATEMKESIVRHCLGEKPTC